MLYSEQQIRTAINNIVTSNGLDSVKVNGVPVGVLSEQSDFSKYGNVILSQPHVANPFINALYQQFIYRATAANIFSSPFNYFRERRDGVAFGTYETDVQPIMPLEFDMYKFDRVLQFWDTPVITQYFAITRMDTFPQTITKTVLRQAFNSYEDFDSFLSKLILAPRQGNTIIETNAVKTMINRNLASGVIKRRAFNAPATDDQWRALAAEIVGVAIGMTAEPTTEYNNYANIDGSGGVEAWAQSDRRDLVLMGDADTISKLRTFVLAMSFNRDDVDFNFTFIPVNNWDYANYDYETRTLTDKQTSPLKILLCDGGFIKFEDNLDDEFADANIMTMGLQRALQVQQTIGLRVSRNALAWVELAEGETLDMYKIIDENPVKSLPVGNDEEASVTINLNKKLPRLSLGQGGFTYDVEAYASVLGSDEKIELTKDNIFEDIIFFDLPLTPDSDGTIKLGRTTENLAIEGVTNNMYITVKVKNIKFNEIGTAIVKQINGEFDIVTPAFVTLTGA